jgi:hypothetical protein
MNFYSIFAIIALTKLVLTFCEPILASDRSIVAQTASPIREVFDLFTN